MKLVRWGEPGAERPGLVDDAGRVRDLSARLSEIDGRALAPDSLAELAGISPDGLPLVPPGTRLGAPLAHVGKFVCIGLNYADHAAEAGLEPPPEPIVFMKATSAITGPSDPIQIPRGSTATDWEVELGVVIGRRARYVTEERALEHVAGYLAVNDVSERDFQMKHHGQWVKGKSHDGFGPIGPWLVTRDEVPDPQDLELRLWVNGELRQAGSTRTMIFPVRQLVAYLSRFMTLEPGDIIATGTPPGVGMGMKPPRFLRPDDRVELEVAGLGRQSCVCVAA